MQAVSSPQEETASPVMARQYKEFFLSFYNAENDAY